MTTTFIHNCDKWGSKIESGRTLFTVESGAIRATRPQIDLCATCTIDFETWLTKGDSTEATSKAMTPAGATSGA